MDYSRPRKCTDSVGGNSELYIFPFVKYNRSEITVVNNMLTVFPYNIIYNLKSVSNSFSEPVDEEEGGVSFNQSVGFQVNKILSTDNFKNTVSQDYRIIIKDNNGNYRLVGLFTGVKGKYTKDTGLNKNENNGYKFTFDTKEENTAPFLNDLSLFNIMPIEGLLIEDGNDNIIQDGNNNELIN